MAHTHNTTHMHKHAHTLTHAYIHTQILTDYNRNLKLQQHTNEQTEFNRKLSSEVSSIFPQGCARRYLRGAQLSSERRWRPLGPGPAKHCGRHPLRVERPNPSC